MGSHYQPECDECGCYMKYNENFDPICTNAECPLNRFKDEQYAENVMLDQSK